MKFTLLIQSAPIDSQSSATALRFARALLAKGHEIERIFFYRSGVQSANRLALAPQDEPNLPLEWQSFISEHQLDAVVCIAAAIRRGIVNAAETARYGVEGDNLIEAAELSGLGQLVAACAASDRVITFGGGA
ncbi:MAG: sulfurtransferase complex subunit TusD [Oceanospirillaceae bacterium]|nr:sulfurtransferase complex subunit TusD [Oceanospirillaceae bacterium]